MQKLGDLPRVDSLRAEELYRVATYADLVPLAPGCRELRLYQTTGPKPPELRPRTFERGECVSSKQRVRPQQQPRCRDSHRVVIMLAFGRSYIVFRRVARFSLTPSEWRRLPQFRCVAGWRRRGGASRLSRWRDAFVSSFPTPHITSSTAAIFSTRCFRPSAHVGRLSEAWTRLRGASAGGFMRMSSCPTTTTSPWKRRSRIWPPACIGCRRPSPPGTTSFVARFQRQGLADTAEFQALYSRFAT
jgi:hypothetical protein